MLSYCLYCLNSIITSRLCAHRETRKPVAAAPFKQNCKADHKILRDIHAPDLLTSEWFDGGAKEMSTF